MTKPEHNGRQQISHVHGAVQGDRLTWLLSTAVAHDITHARGVLLKARARDELMNATMEMRQRAVALHLHFPWKFTLDSRRPVTDVQAVWSEIVRKVEAVGHCWDSLANTTQLLVLQQGAFQACCITSSLLV